MKLISDKKKEDEMYNLINCFMDIIILDLIMMNSIK